MKRRIDMRQAPAPLERTFSTAEVMAYLGCQRTKLDELLALGRRFKGHHPLKGGLFPTFKVSHKNVRVTEAAIAGHLRHMRRLGEDPRFAAEMKAKARELGLKEAA